MLLAAALPGLELLEEVVALVIDEDEGGETGDLVERLMGKKPELRFEYIQENAVYANLDY